MGRLKFVVASLVVLLAIRRFNDAIFIIESFDNGGSPNQRRDSMSRHPRLDPDPASKNNQTNLVPESSVGNNSTDFVAGQFCPSCDYNNNTSCSDRVEYLVNKYAMSEEEAEGAKNAYPQCRFSSHKIYTEEEEPSVIIHVGPHKTGTTALQAFMYDLKSVLLQDNIRIPNYDELPGMFRNEGVGLNLAHCSLKDYEKSGGGMTRRNCFQMKTAFKKFMQDAYDKSQSVLIVAEDFDRVEIYFKRLRIFLWPYKKIKVVVMYRRLHDWLPSWYNQIVDQYSLVYARGEEKYPSFVERLEERYGKFEQRHSIQVADRYRKVDYLESMDMINMHEVAASSNLIEHFFCNHLHAKAVCQAIKDGAKPSKSNVGRDHESERLTIEASLGGKISADLSKPRNLNRATRYMEIKVVEKIKNHNTLPRVCPRSDLLEKILQTEIDHERHFFPEWFDSHGGEDGVRRSFDVSVKKKFCSLDIGNILKSGLLNSIFIDFEKQCVTDKKDVRHVCGK